MDQIALLLEQTLLPQVAQVKQAEEQLRKHEVHKGFAPCLLQLLDAPHISIAAKLAGSIYLKNYIRKYWISDGADGVPDEDRATIKTHLLTLMLKAPKNVQTQLSGAVSDVALADFPGEWGNLLPDMVQHFKQNGLGQGPANISILLGAMQTADSVFVTFRSRPRCNELLGEVKYTVDTFAATHLQAFNLCRERIKMEMPLEELKQYVMLTTSACSVFYSLNFVDLPEFYENHREDFFVGFLEFLTFQHKALEEKIRSEQSGSQKGPVEELKEKTLENLTLYATRYQEEFQPVVAVCVKHVWELLISLDMSDRNDSIVSAGIGFLSAAASTKWAGESPFSDFNALQAICEKIVIPNICLRDEDIERFEEDPLEYIRRDVEQADQDTRRRASMELVKNLGKFYEDQVTKILISYVDRLIQEGASRDAKYQERSRDACIYLVIAMSVRGQTRAMGVTQLNQLVNVMDFYKQQIGPVLTAEPVSEAPILRAACLKYVTTFRNQVNSELQGLLPHICKHVNSKSAVLHTYAAHCIEKILAGPQCLDKQQSTRVLLDMSHNILERVAMQEAGGIPQNEYLMRCLVRIFNFLQDLAAGVCAPTVEKLVCILEAVRKKAVNPMFSHYLFETIAVLVKVAAEAPPQVKAAVLATIEKRLLAVIEVILVESNTDFMPYCFQILGLLLDANDGSREVQGLYGLLFPRLLEPSLWQLAANQPGLIRLFRAYFCKHQFFEADLKGNMLNLLQRFQQYGLMNRKAEVLSFDLLNAIFKSLPLEFYREHLTKLLTGLLVKLQSVKKGSPVYKAFVLSMSLFTRVHDELLLPQIFQAVQPGLFINVIQNIWLPSLAIIRKPQEKKVCSHALARLMIYPDLEPLLGDCCQGLIKLLNLEQTTLRADSKSELLANGDTHVADDVETEFEVAFSKLSNTDLQHDTDAFKVQQLDIATNIKEILKPHAQRLAAIQGVNTQPLFAYLS